ncbi:hypothetical protein OPT61_g7858 [Boeremia exigua]|uniref:Uncharacterized protein n=1 Tax=Boeremia exigua TaxID=749465 RepID=A0ACC2I163_9PLEO|nr:hypothetical protein OPT61_g7858 [Boeremia exigua]
MLDVERGQQPISSSDGLQMPASTSTSFNLDLPLHINPTLLTIYDSESFGSTVDFLHATHTVRADTPFNDIKLSSQQMIKSPSSAQDIHECWAGQQPTQIIRKPENATDKLRVAGLKTNRDSTEMRHGIGIPEQGNKRRRHTLDVLEQRVERQRFLAQLAAHVVQAGDLVRGAEALELALFSLWVVGVGLDPGLGHAGAVVGVRDGSACAVGVVENHPSDFKRPWDPVENPRAMISSSILGWTLHVRTSILLLWQLLVSSAICRAEASRYSMEDAFRPPADVWENSEQREEYLKVQPFTVPPKLLDSRDRWYTPSNHSSFCSPKHACPGTRRTVPDLMFVSSPKSGSSSGCQWGNLSALHLSSRIPTSCRARSADTTLAHIASTNEAFMTHGQLPFKSRMNAERVKLRVWKNLAVSNANYCTLNIRTSPWCSNAMPASIFGTDTWLGSRNYATQKVVWGLARVLISKAGVLCKRPEVLETGIKTLRCPEMGETPLT